MTTRLQCADNYEWDITNIEFAIRERVGDPRHFIGRVEELEYLDKWAGNIRHGVSRSLAFLGRRKIGKSLILERLYNIIYSEQHGLIPFYYEFREGKRRGMNHSPHFFSRLCHFMSTYFWTSRMISSFGSAPLYRCPKRPWIFIHSPTVCLALGL